MATALGSLPAEQGVPRLTVMLQERDLRVIPAVLNGSRRGESHGRWISVLLERLKSDDFVVRATAATGLAEIKAAGAVQPLTEAYRASAGGDVTYVARAAMLSALAKLDPAAARPLLQEALTDRDWAVRVRARTLLGSRASPASKMRCVPPWPVEPVDSPEWRAIVVPTLLTARIHRYRQRDRRTGTGGARRAPHSQQLHDAGAQRLLQRHCDSSRGA